MRNMKKIIIQGQMDNTFDNTFESANRVYYSKTACPTIPTCGGGGLQPKTIRKVVRNNGQSDKRGIKADDGHGE